MDVTRALEGFPNQAVGLGRLLQEMAKQAEAQRAEQHGELWWAWARGRSRQKDKSVLSLRICPPPPLLSDLTVES